MFDKMFLLAKYIIVCSFQTLDRYGRTNVDWMARVQLDTRILLIEGVIPITNDWLSLVMICSHSHVDVGKDLHRT